jgi:hypothetical protein
VVINTLVSSGTGGIVLGIASANISPVTNINGNTVSSFYKFVECRYPTITISRINVTAAITANIRQIMCIHWFQVAQTTGTEVLL